MLGAAGSYFQTVHCHKSATLTKPKSANNVTFHRQAHLINVYAQPSLSLRDLQVTSSQLSHWISEVHSLWQKKVVPSMQHKNAQYAESRFSIDIKNHNCCRLDCPSCCCSHGEGDDVHCDRTAHRACSSSEARSQMAAHKLHVGDSLRFEEGCPFFVACIHSTVRAA